MTLVALDLRGFPGLFVSIPFPLESHEEPLGAPFGGERCPRLGFALETLALGSKVLESILLGICGFTYCSKYMGFSYMSARDVTL